MLLRCARCISRFAHDLLHCPQCGEPAANSAPDPDVVGAPAAEPAEPAAEPAAVPEKKFRVKTAPAVEPDPAPVAEPEPQPEPPAAPAPAPNPAPAEPTA